MASNTGGKLPPLKPLFLGLWNLEDWTEAVLLRNVLFS